MNEDFIKSLKKETKKKQKKILLKEFANPKDLNKKQISVFLKQETINELDKLTKSINNYTKKTTSRNYLIEIAVDSLIDIYPDVVNEYKKKSNIKSIDFDTIICPSWPNGLETFIGESKWYYIRLDKKKISKIKYIALYLGYPIQQITHYAKIEKLEEVPIKNKKKYIAHLSDIIELDKPIILGETLAVATRSIKYTTLEKLLKAKVYADLN